MRNLFYYLNPFNWFSGEEKSSATATVEKVKTDEATSIFTDIVLDGPNPYKVKNLKDAKHLTIPVKNAVEAFVKKNEEIIGSRTALLEQGFTEEGAGVVHETVGGLTLFKLESEHFQKSEFITLLKTLGIMPEDEDGSDVYVSKEELKWRNPMFCWGYKNYLLNARYGYFVYAYNSQEPKEKTYEVSQEYWRMGYDHIFRTVFNFDDNGLQSINLFRLKRPGENEEKDETTKVLVWHWHGDNAKVLTLKELLETLRKISFLSFHDYV